MRMIPQPTFFLPNLMKSGAWSPCCCPVHQTCASGCGGGVEDGHTTGRQVKVKASVTGAVEPAGHFVLSKTSPYIVSSSEKKPQSHLAQHDSIPILIFP